jgi:hypothetical protein
VRTNTVSVSPRRGSALLSLFALATALSACGDEPGLPDATPPDPNFVNGCPKLEEPVAAPGDPIDGDTWTTFAGPFLATWCTRCHSTTLTVESRTGAPPGYDWDVEATAREHLTEIRNAVGVQNYMPFNDPKPTCDERERLVRWIDADAP